VYDCDGQGETMPGPTADGALVSAQWQKGTSQDGGETLAGGYVVHDSEGQCLRAVEGGNVICQVGGNGDEIREDNGNTSADCTESNTGSAECSWQTINISRQCPADNANLDTLFSTMDDRETCRTMQCSRTNCGNTLATPDSWHATKDANNQLTACVKNQKGGNLGTNYTCPRLDSYWDDNYPPATNPSYTLFNAQGLVASQPSQFADGSCARVLGCDHCGAGYNAECPTDGYIWGRGDNEKCGNIFGGHYKTCLYDRNSATAKQDAPEDCKWKSS
jgi:hypothetical protein